LSRTIALGLDLELARVDQIIGEARHREAPLGRG
jgi:hypothetical protein